MMKRNAGLLIAAMTASLTGAFRAVANPKPVPRGYAAGAAGGSKKGHSQEEMSLRAQGFHGQAGTKRARLALRRRLGTKHGSPAPVLRTNGRTF